MCDDYLHFDKNIFYVEENIPGPSELSESYETLIQTYNSQLTNCCKCTKCDKSCPCIRLSGGVNYITYTEEQTGMVTYRLNRTKNVNDCLIIECNDLCKCFDKCSNRLVQKGPKDELSIKTCDANKGLGLFTNKFIEQGSFICEYAGELITKSQAISRYKLNKEACKMNYIFCLNEYCNNTATQIFVDPMYFGNIGRYINHSCEPNCEIIPVRVNSPVPKLAIFSVIDILAGSEITFDYGSNNLNNLHVDTVEKRKICCCNTPSCKGFMPFSNFS